MDIEFSPLVLNDEEIVLLERHRAAKAQHAEACEFKSRAIEVAYAFDRWSLETGEGLTFSAFVNAFNYQEKDGRAMYEAVKRIHEAAWAS